MDRITEALTELESANWYPFHMPGHKRQATHEVWKSVYSRDITEIEGFDNLHHAEGILKEEQEFAAELFGAEESFYLVNGSSCGILASICTVSNQDEEKRKSLLMSRNAHKSAYNGLALSGMRADYLYPEMLEKAPFTGTINLIQLQQALEKKEYQAILITSPTYEGVVSDIEAVCELAHKKQIPVIVDEAHGAHLGLWGGNGYFPESAVKNGADIVIQSLHKTLPSMTQTAILHVQGKLIDRKRLQLYLSMFQSSSPSYILMNSISFCLHFCNDKGSELIENYQRRLQWFYKESGKLCNIEVFHKQIDITRDPGKIIVSGKKCGLNGKELSDILRRDYHLEMEMATSDYVVAMTSVMDTQEGFVRLLTALQEIDCHYNRKDMGFVLKNSPNNIPHIESIYSIKEALDMSWEKLSFEQCMGQVSREFVYVYPPGIPLIVPGERISFEVVRLLQQAKDIGLQVQGTEDYLCREICCIKE